MSRSETLRQNAQTSERLGFHTGRIPLGYLPGDRGGESVADMTRFPHIIEARERFKVGEFTVAHARDFLLLKGVRSAKGRMLARSTVHAILTNPYYDGYARRKGRTFLRLN